MTDFKEALKGAAGCMTTESDIIKRAKHRIKSPSPIRRLAPVLSAAAAVVLCTFTVSAVKYGWLNVVFGESGNAILENPSNYSLEISGIETECRLPDGEISLNDVICDGEAMYINLRLTGTTEEDIQKYADSARIYLRLTTADGTFKSTEQAFSIGVTDHGEDFVEMYASISSADGIDIGDKADFKFYNLSEEMYDPNENYDFRIVFDVAEEPTNLTTTLSVNRDVTFESVKYNKTTKMTVDSILISPLTFKAYGTLKGEKPHVDMVGAIADPDTLTFVMSDGSKIPMRDLCGGYGYGGSGNGDGSIYINTFFDRVFPVDDLAGIEIGDSYIEVDR